MAASESHPSGRPAVQTNHGSRTQTIDTDVLDLGSFGGTKHAKAVWTARQ